MTDNEVRLMAAAVFFLFLLGIAAVLTNAPSANGVVAEQEDLAHKDLTDPQIVSLVLSDHPKTHPFFHARIG
jgi:hypothetical protein